MTVSVGDPACRQPMSTDALEQACSSADTRVLDSEYAPPKQRDQPVSDVSGTSTCGPRGANTAGVDVGVADGVAPGASDDDGVAVELRLGVRVGVMVRGAVPDGVTGGVIDADGVPGGVTVPEGLGGGGGYGSATGAW